jgi:hypothetical protein
MSVQFDSSRNRWVVRWYEARAPADPAAQAMVEAIADTVIPDTPRGPMSATRYLPESVPDTVRGSNQQALRGEPLDRGHTPSLM